MFVFFVMIAAVVFIADEDANPKDVYARLGVPKIEKWDYRIHVRKEGQWTVQISQAYGIEGMTEEGIDALKEMSFDEVKDSRMTSMSDSCWISENRCECKSSGKCNDALELASLLVRVFEDDKCDFLKWDCKSFEWKFSRDDGESSRDDEKSFATLGAEVAVKAILSAAFEDLDAAFEETISKNGMTKAELASLAKDLPKSQLVLTTDGRITADAPAEVSEDGKTLTLDLSKFRSDPPQEWSIRIDGL